MAETTELLQGVAVLGALKAGYDRVLTADAIAFVADLERKFGPERSRLLARRAEIQAPARCGLEARFPRRDAGRARRRLERGADPARSSGSPRRDHRPDRPQDGDQRAQLRRQCLHGRFRGCEHAYLGQSDRGPDQPHRRGAPKPSRSTIPRDGRHYALNPKTATLLVRPRGWHLPEAHVLVEGEPMSGSLFDFGLFFFHNADELVARGTGPYFYLPKIESHLEARLWNDVFLFAQAELGLPKGDGASHGADRDHHGRLRDGRDHPRAARAFGRPQLRPLGLHLQLHQEIQRRSGMRAAGPRASHDDHPLPAQLYPAADQDLPPPQGPCHGRHGRADPDQRRPRRQRGGNGQGARRQGARGRRRP